jgi:hypothetical protein
MKKQQKILPGKLYKIKPLGYSDFSLGHSHLEEGTIITIFPHEILMFIEKTHVYNYHFLRSDGTKVIFNLGIDIENWPRIEKVAL